MRILIWNCRGLGQAQTVQELARLVREFKPDLVFLSETRQNKAVVVKVCSRVGFSNCLPINMEGKGGGSALFVSDSVTLDLLSYGPHHIDTHVTDHDGNKIRYTFVYGEPRP
jgi:exonuclease III